MQIDKICWMNTQEKNFYLNVRTNINIKLLTEGLIKYLEDMLEGDIKNEDEIIKAITS